MKETAGYFRNRGIEKPDITILTGSGFTGMDSILQNIQRIPYTEIPEFPQTGVRGHLGIVYFGRYQSLKILLFEGRKHLYEGEGMNTVTFFPECAASLGSRVFLQCNAAGAINSALKPGDLVLWNSYFSLSIPHNSFMRNKQSKTKLFSQKLTGLVLSAAEKAGVSIKTGTSVYVTGPSYETKSEIKMFRRLGGDMISMSSVPEAAAAISLGMHTASLSLITNSSAGTDEPLTHSQVLSCSEENKNKITSLFSAVFSVLSCLKDKSGELLF